jgi:outer membrane receptor protein involved in Fe transport
MPFSLSFSGNWRHLFKFELNNADVITDLKYVQKNTASFGLEFNDKKRFSSRINARIIGSRLEDNWFYTFNFETWERIPLTSLAGNPIRPTLINEDILEYPTFVVVDLSAAFQVNKNLSVGLAVQNILDELYTEKDGYFMPGRNFLVRLGYSF